MNINFKCGVSGYYEIGVRRNAASNPDAEIEWSGKHHNLILDNFFTRWLSGNTRFSAYMYVGTGATATANEQTALVSPIGGPSNLASAVQNNTIFDGTDYISSTTFTSQWNLGAVVGNLNEIGVRLSNIYSVDATNLDSRALTVNPVGEQTSIPVLVTDQLVAKYTLKYRIPIAVEAGATVFNSVPTNYTLETLNVFSTQSWGTTAVLNSQPFGISTGPRISNTQEVINNVEFTAGAVGVQSITNIGYSIASGKIRATYSVDADDWNNVGPIKYLVILGVSGQARQGIHFDPPLAKDNTKTLVLNFDYGLERA
ncbi:hypothetical protein [Arsukibacterium indicum]|uniref:Uncharacterized protein n=1 Tax=Arsukibacterium indicum TaxID=2848612 RepID=A0ABS6MH73_9GAMM|nr:hypothetical protein [Arsukibacterium indicum]MBV2128157.1 hypothetical protein [Arsukibacterium indicum]